MSLLSIVASSSAFRLPASPPPKGSSIDSDWSTKNKKQPGFLRLISAWYAMVFLHFSWHHENYDSHMPEVTGWSPVATIPSCLIVPTGRTRRDPDHAVTGLRRGVAESRPTTRGAAAQGECLTSHGSSSFSTLTEVQSSTPVAPTPKANSTSNRIDAPLDAPIRNEPNERDQHIEGVSDPDFDEGQQDRRGIEHRRYLPLQ